MSDPVDAPEAVFHRDDRTVAKHILYGGALTIGIAALVWYRDIVVADLAPSLAAVPVISIPVAESILTWILLLVFVSSIPLFVATTAFLLYRRANPVPALVIDADGFTDRTSLTNLGRVPWTNVDHLEIVEQMNVPQLRVTLDDPDRLLANHGPLKARYLQLYRRAMRGDGAIPLHQLDASIGDVVSAIEHYSTHTVTT